MPADIPKVAEIGASSAPLMSASYFIGARCRAYNDDYMQCKTEAYGRGELDCMLEGRKVTRCAASVYVCITCCLVAWDIDRYTIRLRDINNNCLEVFRQHWECLDNNNHQMWQCRRPERKLNRCVFEKIVRFDGFALDSFETGLANIFKQGLEKVIPDSPKGEVPVHLRDRQIFADNRVVVYPWERDVDIPKKDAEAPKSKAS